MNRWALVLSLVSCAGCGVATDPVSPPGAGVAIDVAALNLSGVGDVVWDIEVDNGRSPTADVVWQRRITSSGYGDGAGSASYIGPCDADPAVAQNTIKVWVVGVYASAVSSSGAFNSGLDTGVGAVTGTPIDFQNPTTGGPLTQVVTCAENVDVPVQFDVALMRPAQQGFFDIAVNFNDIFCSAKLDCCADTNGDGCAGDGSEDIDLLFDASGARARTIVLGFACTAGAADGVTTDLYLDPIALDCDVQSDGTTFVADVSIDPATGGPGNVCTAGALSACAAVTEESGAVDADTYLFQIATFRGQEQLETGGVDARKVYWNVALGANAGISACTLRTRGTADDAANAGDNVVNGVIAAGTVYPYIAWDVDLASCGSEPLTFDDPSAAVTTAYTATGDGATSFAYHYAAGASAGSFCDPVCENGGVCVAGVCDCDGTGYTGATCDAPVTVISGAASLDGTSAYLSRTFAAAGDQRRWVFSGFVKRADPGARVELLQTWTGNLPSFAFTANGYFQWNSSAASDGYLLSSRVFRDPSAWYHVVVALDTTQAVASDRIRVWINGEQITSWSSATWPSQNQLISMNAATAHDIGYWSGGPTYSQANLAQIAFFDGLTIADPLGDGLAERDANGVLRPTDLGALAFGGNGFLLDFADPGDLGADASGQGNGFNTHGGLQAIVDTPEDNYATLNAISHDAVTFSLGATRATNPNNDRAHETMSTQLITAPTYWEVTRNDSPGEQGASDGVAYADTAIFSSTYDRYAGSWTGSVGIYGNGRVWDEGVNVSQPAGSAEYAGSVRMYAYDPGTGEFWAGLDGTWLAGGDPATGTGALATIDDTSRDVVVWATVHNGVDKSYDFGQRGFVYAPPAGFSPLTTSAIPAPAVQSGATAVQTSLYTGNGTAQAITGLGFTPDLVVVKSRSNATSSYWYDTLRGAGARIVSDGAYTEAAISGVTSFDADGFSVGTETGNNGAGQSYVAWSWKAGGAGVANGAGSSASTVSVNPTAGFSIVTYTGTGAVATVGHGLPTAPDFVLFKSRTNSYGWAAYHRELGATQALQLHTNGAATTSAAFFDDTAPTASAFTVGTSGQTNAAGEGFVAYAWTAVPGYSKFGRYTGTQDTYDTPFVNLGFTPAFLMVKRADGNSDWFVVDLSRSPDNVVSEHIAWNTTNAENTSADVVDVVANGFKVRSGGAHPNIAGTYIYAAFAAYPFGGDQVTAAPAR